jgi:NAD(P)-dependent dehydrogenase (short-subunit alcohol dehydrogenase family)
MATTSTSRSNTPPEAGVAWVAGVGASAGLGAAVARRFAREGLVVALTGRTSDRLRSVADEINGAGGSAVSLPGNVTDPSDLSRLLAELPAGTLRAAVYNAGNAVRGTPLDISPEQFETAWRVGTLGGFLFARAILPRLLAAGAGSILFTGASASLRGRGPFVAFAAAKAGLRSVAQSFAREYGPQGIHVAHVIIDGGIDGERLRAAAPQYAESVGIDGLLSPDAIAESYWQIHQQPRSAWTHDLDLRPYKESF